jgi:hypothetical protein
MQAGSECSAGLDRSSESAMKNGTVGKEKEDRGHKGIWCEGCSDPTPNARAMGETKSDAKECQICKEPCPPNCGYKFIVRSVIRKKHERNRENGKGNIDKTDCSSCKCQSGCSPEFWEAESANQQLSGRFG